MRRRIVQLSIPWLLAAGCHSHYKEYREVPFEDVPFETLWRVCLETAQTEFRIEPSGVDLGNKTFTSKWRKQIGRGFRRGRRRRTHFEIVSEAPKKHVVRYYVEQQKIGEISRAMNPTEDDWEPHGQDGNIETRLLHHLRVRLAVAMGKPIPGVRGVRIEDPMRPKRRE